MRKTKNHQLNQWDDTDRILREDFNRDNALIDAKLTSTATAISTEAANRKQADDALQNSINQRSIMTLLKTVTTSEQATQVNLNLSGINWGSYQSVILEVIGTPSGYGGGTVRLNNSGRCMQVSGPSESGIASINFNCVTIIYLPVFHHPERQAFAFSIGLGLGYGYEGPAYRDITTINLVGSDKIYSAGRGTVINIWGVK